MRPGGGTTCRDVLDGPGYERMSVFKQYEAQSMGTTSLPSSTAERQPPFAAGSDSQVRRSSGASFEDRDRSPCKIASTGFIDT